VTCSGTMAHVATRQRARRATQEGVWFFLASRGCLVLRYRLPRLRMWRRHKILLTFG
jgi:hypothetical protein